jgi:hypothetical protein
VVSEEKICLWRPCFRGEDFQKWTNQKQELPMAAMEKKLVIFLSLTKSWITDCLHAVIGKSSPLKPHGQIKQNLQEASMEGTLCSLL